MTPSGQAADDAASALQALSGLIDLPTEATSAQVCSAIANAMGADLCGILRPGAEPGTYRFVAGHGWPEDMVGTIVAASNDATLGFVLRSAEPVVYEDLMTEDRFVPPRILIEHGVRSGIGAAIRDGERIVGVLGIHSVEVARYGERDASLASVAIALVAQHLVREDVQRAREREAARVTSLADHVSDLVFRLRLQPEVRFEYLNDRITDHLGYKPSEIVGDAEATRALIHPEDRATLFAPRTTSALIRMHHRTGAPVAFEVHLETIADVTGRVVAIEGIARDLAGRASSEEDLRRAYQHQREITAQLRSVDAMKNTFLQAVSHELRTPLAAVMGLAVTIADRFDQLTDEDRRTMIARVAANAEHLNELLTNLLDLDRLMRRMIEPARQPTDLARSVELVASNAQVGERTLTIDTREVVAAVDGPMVERIVENLIMNAARHTPPGSTIWVLLEPAADGALLTVADDGPGIPPEHRASIFEPFARAPTTHEHQPGTGIGLSLVARFAELHGGRAWVEERPGGGAQFRVLIPGPVGASSIADDQQR